MHLTGAEIRDLIKALDLLTYEQANLLSNLRGTLLRLLYDELKRKRMIGEP